MVDYYDNEAISQSKLKKFIESKAQYKTLYIDNYIEGVDSENMKFGRFYHNYIYEFETLRDRYIVLPSDSIIGGMMGSFIQHKASGLDNDEAYTLSGFKQSLATTINQFEKVENKAYYNLLLEAQGKNIVSELDRNIAKKMKEVYLQENTVLAKVIKNNNDWYVFSEQEIFFKSSFSTLNLKLKVDRIYIKKDFSEVIIEDLKTTEDLNLKEFIRTIKRYRYDIQQSFYKLGVQYWIEEKYNELVPVQDIEFIFIPQRKKYPYDIIDFIEVDSLSEHNAYNEWTDALTKLEFCMVTNNWKLDKSTYEGNRKLVKL